MNMEEIVARGQRASAAGDTAGLARAACDLREWLGTEQGLAFLVAAMCPPPRRIFAAPAPVLPTERIAVPATLEPLGEARSVLVGALESTMSEREFGLVDGVNLEWADWDPYRRTITVGDGVGVVVPVGVPLSQAAMSVLNCQVAMWPEAYMEGMK